MKTKTLFAFQFFLLIAFGCGGGPDNPDKGPTSGQIPPPTGLNSAVQSLLIAGNNLYAGGSFTNAGGHSDADGVARWNGDRWEALGTGSPWSIVTKLAISSSGELYVAGSATNGARFGSWDGNQWRFFGTTVINGGVIDIFIDNTDVYVAGGFTDAGGISEADYVARWDGSAWHSVGGTLTANGARAIAVHSGIVYVNMADDTLLQWKDNQWQPLAGTTGLVRRIVPYQNDTYFCGSLDSSPGGHHLVTKWDGANLTEVGSRISDYINDCVITPNGVFVAGRMLLNGDVHYAAHWDGTSWRDIFQGSTIVGGSIPPSSTYYGASIVLSGSLVFLGGLFW